MSSRKCPTCAVAMNEGFIPDHSHHGVPTEPQWTEGAPQKSFWRGLDLRNRERFPISTFRCPKCGLLQSYALGTDTKA